MTVKKDLAAKAWITDIAAYHRWEKLFQRQASPWATAFAEKQMHRIKAKWPGKEKLFE